jgi:poly(3-hydroxybutyrate) depolymerase
MYERLIENLTCTHDINPNKVYIMGYSAGGDGTY